MGFAGFQPIWENPGVRERPYLKGKDGESVVKEDTQCVLLASVHSHTHIVNLYTFLDFFSIYSSLKTAMFSMTGFV